MLRTALRSAPVTLPVAALLVLAARLYGPQVGDAPLADASFVDSWPAGTSTTLLIDVADDLSGAERAAFLESLPADAALNSAFSEREGLYRLTLDREAAIDLYASLQHDRHVEFIEPELTLQLVDPLNTVVVPFEQPLDGGEPVRPNDPLYPFQWHFEQIGVESAWGASRGAGTVVAVIDTGVAYTSDTARRLTAVRDLSQTRMVPGYDFVTDDARPLDEHGHGTHVAGTIAQSTNNAYGVAGIAPAAAIMPIRVLDGSGRGNTADIAESIRWAADNGAHVINMSLGGPMPSRIMNDAVQYAVQKGVTVIAAAGNSSSRLPSYPAAYPNVISVSATQYDRTTTFYSNYGPTIDVAAPGGNTRVDQNNDGRPDGVLQETLAHGDISRHDFSLYMGTSMAAPHVAGVAALLHSRGVTRPDRMEQLLESTATREVPQFEPNRYGAGIIQARAALDAAGRSQTLPAGLLGLALGAGLWMTASKRRLQGGGTSVLFALGASGVAAGLAWLGSSPFGLADCALSQAAGAWVNPVLHVGLHNAAFASVAVPLAAYAVFGGVRNRRLMTALLVGLAGFAAWLLASAALPFADLLGVPGSGLADSLWMLVNAAGAMAIASAALREH